MNGPVYIAGPMRGYPEDNHPAFHKAQEWLEDWGYAVENPALINEHLDFADTDHTFADYMRNDLFYLVGCGAILLLQGWRHSVGATVEMVVAQALDMQVGYAPEPEFMNTHRKPLFFSSEKPAIPWKTINRLRETDRSTNEHVIDAHL